MCQGRFFIFSDASSSLQAAFAAAKAACKELEASEKMKNLPWHKRHHVILRDVLPYDCPSAEEEGFVFVQKFPHAKVPKISASPLLFLQWRNILFRVESLRDNGRM